VVPIFNSYTWGREGKKKKGVTPKLQACLGNPLAKVGGKRRGGERGKKRERKEKKGGNVTINQRDVPLLVSSWIEKKKKKKRRKSEAQRPFGTLAADIQAPVAKRKGEKK